MKQRESLFEKYMTEAERKDAEAYAGMARLVKFRQETRNKFDCIMEASYRIIGEEYERSEFKWNGMQHYLFEDNTVGKMWVEVWGDQDTVLDKFELSSFATEEIRTILKFARVPLFYKSEQFELTGMLCSLKIRLGDHDTQYRWSGIPPRGWECLARLLGIIIGLYQGDANGR